MNPSNPGATKPIFWIYVRYCLNKDCLGPSLENRKSQFCQIAAKKCCGSGNCLICTLRGGQKMFFGGGGGFDDVEEEIDVSEAKFS